MVWDRSCVLPVASPLLGSLLSFTLHTWPLNIFEFVGLIRERRKKVKKKMVTVNYCIDYYVVFVTQGHGLNLLNVCLK